jgi:hypothetical protein
MCRSSVSAIRRRSSGAKVVIGEVSDFSCAVG